MLNPMGVCSVRLYLRVIYKMMMMRRHTRILIVMHQKWGSIGKVVLVVL